MLCCGLYFDEKAFRYEVDYTSLLLIAATGNRAPDCAAHRRQINGPSRSASDAEIPAFFSLCRTARQETHFYGLVDRVEQRPLSEPKLTLLGRDKTSAFDPKQTLGISDRQSDFPATRGGRPQRRWHRNY